MHNIALRDEKLTAMSSPTVGSVCRAARTRGWARASHLAERRERLLASLGVARVICFMEQNKRGFCRNVHHRWCVNVTMRGVLLHVSCVALCVGLFVAAQTAPSLHAAAGRALDAPPQVSRLAERAHVEQMLASARPPVPWVREQKLRSLCSTQGGIAQGRTCQGNRYESCRPCSAARGRDRDGPC